MLQKSLITIACIALSSIAHAQKANDTLRIAYKAPIVTTDVYTDPQPETSLTSAAVYDTLITFDSTTKTFRPSLAESWVQLDPTTIDMKLRKGITFHDGSHFTADDVVYTLNYLINPKSNIRFTSNWTFPYKIEKIDEYSVRITGKTPTPYALARLATTMPIYPAAIHGKLDDKASFGRRFSIGTGPYKVVSLDANQGILLVRNEAYRPPGSWSQKPSIKFVRLLPIPDPQTQIAQIITGGVDIILEAPKDQSEQLASLPNVTTTAIETTAYTYLGFDAAGRSGVKPLIDVNVRRALAMAIDRQGLAKAIMSGGDLVRVIDAPCNAALQIGCVVDPANLTYDPKAARELLTKAGYPNGFDVEITTIPGAEKLGEAIAGQFMAVGVRAKVENLTFGAYRQKQNAGKLQILVAHYSSAGLTDVNAAIDLYVGSEQRDYWRDTLISEMAAKASQEMDGTVRNDLLKQVFNAMNEKRLLLPLTTFPSVVVHSRDVTMPRKSTVFTAPALNNMMWK